MSTEQTFPTSDLRKSAQEYRRDAERKHKWALGAVVPTGRAEAKPRPHRPSDANTTKRPHPTLSRSARLSRAHDIADGSAFATSTTSSDDSSPSADEHDDQLEQAISPTPDASVMYSFDASRGPSHGSQILNVALAKAIEKYEDKQTDKLVRSEWEVVDEDGESSGVGSKKGRGRGKGKVLNADEVATKAAEDEDYEFV